MQGAIVFFFERVTSALKVIALNILVQYLSLYHTIKRKIKLY